MRATDWLRCRQICWTTLFGGVPAVTNRIKVTFLSAATQRHLGCGCAASPHQRWREIETSCGGDPLFRFRVEPRVLAGLAQSPSAIPQNECDSSEQHFFQYCKDLLTARSAPAAKGVEELEGKRKWRPAPPRPAPAGNGPPAATSNSSGFSGPKR